MKALQRCLKCLILALLLIGLGETRILAQSNPSSVVAQTQVTGAVYTVDWSFDGQYLAISSDQGIRIYNATLQELTVLYTNQAIYSVNWHPSLAKLAITVGTNIEIWNWSASTNTLSQVAVMPNDKIQRFVEWNLDGSLLASVGIDNLSPFQSDTAVGHIIFWDGNTYTLRLTAPTLYLFHLQRPTADVFAWSPNQTTLFGGIGNGIVILPDNSVMAETGVIVYVIDANTGNRIREISLGEGAYGYSFAWQKSGNYIAVGDEYGAGIFDYNTGLLVSPLVGNNFDIFALSWSPNGQYIVADNGIFDLEIFDHIGDLGGAGVTITTSAWNPDGIHLTIGTADGYISLQDTTVFPDFEPPATVMSFSLRDSASNPIAGFDPLIGGAQLDLVTLPTAPFSIRANTNPETVGSVVFDLNGVVQTDDTAPYEFSNWQPTVGQYTLTATPYSGAGGTGIAGTPLTINFSVTSELTCDVTITAEDSVALINAITTGNAAGTAYTLCLTESWYILNAVHNSTGGDNGLPAITGDIRIYGNNATLYRDINAAPFRFFHVAANASLTLDTITLRNGSSSLDGGAIYNLGTALLDTASFFDNQAQNFGGAIYNQNNLNFQSGYIESSSASDGAGIYNTASLSVDNSNFVTSSSSSRGAGIFNTGTLTVTNSSFIGNQANNGAGIWNDSTGTVSLSGLTFLNNTALSEGAALVNHGTASLDNSYLEGNTANTAGAIANYGSFSSDYSNYISNSSSAGAGGAIHNSNQMTLTDLWMSGNHASSSVGGTVWNAVSASLTSSGIGIVNAIANDGAAFYNLGTATVDNAYFQNNTANLNAGAIYNAGTLSSDNSQYLNNTASAGDGGAFYSTGILSLTGYSLLDSNVATLGNGGGVAALAGSLDVSNSSLKLNTAGGIGGAIYSNANVGTSGIHSSCIFGNAANSTSGVHSLLASLDASSNWWGASDGPSGAGSGSGDAVNANVIFAAFSTSDCTGAINTSSLTSSTEEGVVTAQGLAAAYPASSLNLRDLQTPVQAPFAPTMANLTLWRQTGTWQVSSNGSLGLQTTSRNQDNILEFLLPIQLNAEQMNQVTIQDQYNLQRGASYVVEILPEGSDSWQVLYTQTNTSSNLQSRSFDLSAYQGQVIRLRFRLQTNNANNRNASSMAIQNITFALSR